MPNSIYRGGGIDTPKTLTLSWPSSPSASANQLPFTPGTAVVIGGPASAIYADPVLAVTQANSANRGRIGLLAHADYEEMPSFLTEGSTNDVDPLYTLIGTDWRPWLVYLIEPGQEYQWAVVTGSYSAGQEFTIGLGGRLTAALSGDTVVATLDNGGFGGAPMGFTFGALADVTIVEFYKKY